MTKINLNNTFHMSTASAHLRDDGTVSRRVARRLRRDLCGSDECACSGYLGERGGEWAPHGDVPGIADEDGNTYSALYADDDGRVHLEQNPIY